jgi:hypothetical protein
VKRDEHRKTIDHGRHGHVEAVWRSGEVEGGEEGSIMTAQLAKELWIPLYEKD